MITSFAMRDRESTTREKAAIHFAYLNDEFAHRS